MANKIPTPRSTNARIRILAYLGQLKKDSFVAARNLCLDLDIRYTTAKNILSGLEDRMIVEKRLVNKPNVVAEFRLHPGAHIADKDNTLIPYIPPEWDDAYGKHPHSS